METIASYYGNTMETFCHLATEWNYMAYEYTSQIPYIYEQFISQCSELIHVVLGVEIPLATLTVVAKATKLDTFLVDRDQLLLATDGNQSEQESEIDDVSQDVSLVLRKPWQPLPAVEFIKETRKLIKVFHSLQIKY